MRSVAAVFLSIFSLYAHSASGARELPYSILGSIRAGASFSDLCREVSILCLGLYGSWNCTSNRQATDPEHQAAVRDYIAKRVYQLVRSPQLQEECCGFNSDCAARFALTRLMTEEEAEKDAVLADAATRNAPAYYEADQMPFFGIALPFVGGTQRHRVYFSENIMPFLTSREAVDGVLFHELGHACQFSRHYGSLTYFHLLNNDFGFSDMSTRYDLKELFGPRVTECVQSRMAGVAREALEAGKDVSYGSWMIEAFADLVFMRHYTNLAHWAGLCHAMPDELHGPPSAFASCYFEGLDGR